MTTIQVSAETLQQLRIKKVHNQHKSYDELIVSLLGKDKTPISTDKKMKREED